MPRLGKPPLKIGVSYLGVDPGQSGGICLIDPEGPKDIVKIEGKTDYELFTLLQQIVLREKDQCRVVVAALERVHAMPKQGVSSTFKFGTSYGFLRGVLTALGNLHGMGLVEVRPQVWQGDMKCLSGGDKAKTRLAAQRLWPKLTKEITNKTADAMLIAEWCRRANANL
jgi:hypothetical protein